MPDSPAPRRYLIKTFGCQMNEHDSQRLALLLQGDGMVPAQGIDDADVVVFNTCCIRENADNKLYGHLGQLKAVKDRRPDLQIAVGGCLAQKDKERVQARAPWVDAVWGTHNLGHAAELLAAAADGGPVLEIVDEAPDGEDAFPSALPVRQDQPWAAWVTIQVGCDNNCAFCIVPAVRGPEASRPFGQIVAELEGLAAGGVVETTLLGQNVNSYGRDLTVRARAASDWRSSSALTGARWCAGETPRARPLFADLLHAVAAVPGIRRVRYTSPHPKDLRPETIEAMASEAAVCPQLHLPLQSGSDRVLALMHRGYTARRYLERVAAARGAIDDLAVTTDIIVGFPGETDADFERTLEVVEAAGYDSAYTFIYSPRPGTEAAVRGDEFVPAEVVGERFQRLRDLVERSALARHESRVGRVEEVLVEGPSKRDPAAVSGRTAQGKLVHIPIGPVEPPSRGVTWETGGPAAGPGRRIAPGTWVDARITRAAPHFLVGELVAVTARPAHRTLIPVVAG